MSEPQMVHLRIRGEDGKMRPVMYFKGDKGDKGDAGENGVGITEATINTANELVITLSNGTFINLGNVKGAKGDKGDKGDTGATGPKGDKGRNIVVASSVPTSAAGYNEGDLILVLK